MKKFLVVALVALLMLSVAAVAGCGSDDDDAKRDEPTVNGPADWDEDAWESTMEWSISSMAGTYESADGRVIELMEGGSFETDAWNGMKEGFFVLTQIEDNYWVELNFDDGSTAMMSAIISMDEVAAIVDNDTLIQYTRK